MALSECVGGEPADPDAHLAAILLLPTWAVALTQAHSVFKQRRNTKDAEAAFLAVVVTSRPYTSVAKMLR